MVDDQKLLQQIARMTEENNEMLRSMRRAQRWGRFMKILWWLFIIGTSVASYYYLQPLFVGILETYEKILGGSGTPGSPSILLDKGLSQQLLEQVQAFLGMAR